MKLSTFFHGKYWLFVRQPQGTLNEKALHEVWSYKRVVLGFPSGRHRVTSHQHENINTLRSLPQ